MPVFCICIGILCAVIRGLEHTVIQVHSFLSFFNKCVTLMHELALIDLRIENDIACIEVKEKS